MIGDDTYTPLTHGEFHTFTATGLLNRLRSHRTTTRATTWTYAFTARFTAVCLQHYPTDGLPFGRWRFVWRTRHTGRDHKFLPGGWTGMDGWTFNGLHRSTPVRFYLPRAEQPLPARRCAYLNTNVPVRSLNHGRWLERLTT